MNTKINNIYKIGAIVIITLALFVILPVQSVNAGWITSNIFGGGNHLTDDILGIDPPSHSTPVFTATICSCPALSVSCSANPSSVQTGVPTTFSPTVSGGTKVYTYSWSGACVGTSSSCTNTFGTAGPQSATVTVKSGCKTQVATCSVNVTQPIPTLAVSCSANPGSIVAGNSSTLAPTVTGGTGSYTYAWTGACTGTSTDCIKTYPDVGTQSSTVTVTSGSQTQTASCSVNVTQNCTDNYQQRCVGNSNYWYSSCGTQGNYVGTCGNTCTPNSQQRCVGTSMYWYDSCGTQGNYVGTCGNTCTPNSQQRCLGNNLYSYDSCGTQGNLIQYCANGCSGSTCIVNSNASLTVTKTVRNLTTSTGFSSLTYATPSNMLMYMITVQNTSNQDANNVVIRDILPANLTYNNQLIVARSSGAYNNYSGDIMSGVNLNTISAGQTVTITYQVQVAPVTNFSFGTTTLNNNVSATSSNANGGNATASVIVTRAGVLGASTISTGLTNNFWVDSFFLPLLLTLIGIWMWKAGMFFGIERWLDNKRKARRGYKAEKELSIRIAQIQKLGNK